jgi:hypothetical protein
MYPFLDETDITWEPFAVARKFECLRDFAILGLGVIRESND